MKFSFTQPFTLDTTVRLAIISVVAVLAIIVMKYLSPVLLPFFVAWLFAYLLYPCVLFVQQKMRVRNRSIATALVMIAIFGVVAGALTYFIPTVAAELSSIKGALLNWVQGSNSQTLREEWQHSLHEFLIGIDVKSLLERESILSSIKGIFPHAWGLVHNTIDLVISSAIAFLVMLYVFFILKDYEKLKDGFVAMVPSHHKQFVAGLLDDMGSQMSKYYRGQAFVAFIVSILFAIGFSIIGLPLAVVMGVITGLLNLVPYLQAVSIPATILLMVIESIKTGGSIGAGLLGLAIVYAVVQLIQDLILTPKIMGETMGLNPAIMLLALSVWGMLLGVLGLIIALPATSLFISYYKRHILTRME